MSITGHVGSGHPSFVDYLHPPYKWGRGGAISWNVAGSIPKGVTEILH
jgi:hypothetical protein